MAIMTWADLHRLSETLAADALVALRAGNLGDATALYSKAADAEEQAIGELDPSKQRTIGITAVSAVSLWFKAHEYVRAERLAFSVLSRNGLPDFAANDLRLLVQTIWTESSKRQAGVSFLPGQVTVSGTGGQIITGGAPLDLIVDKVQTIQALFYRTIEFLKGMPHRFHGPPIREIQESCRPWLFQAPPGSYQFSVAIQEPAQKDFFKENIKPDQVALHFLEIVKATSADEPKALEAVVPDRQYRTTFLKLSRNLAPTGRTFEMLEIKAAGEPRGIVLATESRSAINKTIRQQETSAEKREGEEEVSLKGVLRAVHLDKDWLEVTAEDRSMHIEGLKDTIDDVIGPMVNRQVIVRAVKSGKTKLRFVDIELDE
jgi:hypothetical protein